MSLFNTITADDWKRQLDARRAQPNVAYDQILFQMSLVDTLGNRQWLQQNEPKLRELLPETWTLATNLNGLKLGFGLKVVGVDWRSEDEFGRVMVFLEKVGIMQRKDYCVRRNPDLVFA